MKETQKIYSPLRDYPMFEDDPEDSSKSPLLLHPNRPGAGNASAGKVRSVPEREEELPKTEKREEEAEEVPEYVFRIKYILCAIALVLFLMAIFSYDPLDSSIIDGGTKAPLSNWGGQIGACLSKYFFYIFGLASYPIVLLLSLCAVRPFIPVPMKRKGYFLSLAAVILGITLLMAISPQDFVLRTDALGIGRTGAPLLALSGGALGAFFAAPETEIYPAGLLRQYIGTVGTVVAATVLLVSGLVFLFLADWKDILLRILGAKEHKKTLLGRPVPQEEEEASPLITNRTSLRGKRTPVPEENVPAVPLEEETPAPAEQNEEEEKKPETEEEETPEPVRKVLVTTGDEPEETPEEKAHSVPEKRSGAEEKGQDSFAADRKEKALGPDSGKSQEVVFNGNFQLPAVPMLTQPPTDTKSEDADHLNRAKATLQATLDSFDIAGHVSGTVVGPRITRFEITLEPGVKVEKITGIQGNIAMDMCASSIRVLAPIPGKNAVGVEVPNKVSNMVFIRELFESAAWRESHANIPIILGKDVAGKVIVTDLAKAPHLLIAGTTGSGKSVCMNTLIMSLLYKFSPFDLKLIMVDPKFVELELYRPLPHLITPLVNDPKKVPFALRWGVNEMEHRYQMLARVKAKDLNAFNSRPKDPKPVADENGDIIPQKLPYLVIIVDELADIMMTDAKSDVETSICRIAQKGRAAGIHLVIATQTPRKDIITGTIKANLPSKISFKVASFTDSRVVLDAMGAEKLLGKGDMLFKGPSGEMERIQGSLVSDEEIAKTVEFVASQVPQQFNETVLLEQEESEDAKEPEDGENSFPEIDLEEPDEDGNPAMNEFVQNACAKYLKSGDDPKLKKALEIMLLEGKISTSYLQRRMTIGYNTAAEIIDTFEKRGIVSAPLPGGQKRTILVFDELGRPDQPAVSAEK
ncbi:MAG: DNA translocase FtsK [Lentisphaeria bacterium]|nr:DNA translocase FtsK [Lentisphaeria bacterium]